MANDHPSGGDAYRPIAPFLPLLDRLLELALAHVRRGVVRLLRERGAHRVLDLGCGTGPLSRRLADAGLLPVCLDASPTMLAGALGRACQPPRFPVVLGDARRLPFGPVFDAVVLSLALHEMDPPLRAAAWAEMHRVLRPDGVLVVVDFTLPERPGRMSRLAGAVIAGIERRAGWMHPPHYANYRALMAYGGLTAWISAHGGRVLAERHHFWGNLGVVVVAAR